jgi:hypothetical protein
VKEQNRDWGYGFACAGRSNTNDKVSHSIMWILLIELVLSAFDVLISLVATGTGFSSRNIWSS